MISPEEIEHKEFVATMRGYDRDEVAAFLRVVAGDVRRLQHELAVRPEPAVPAPAPEPAPIDPEAVLGAQVADIIRSARAAAEAQASATEQTLAELQAEAERRAAELQGEATRRAEQARREAARLLEQARGEAAQLVAAARAEADRLLEEALHRQERIETANRATLGAFGQVERQMAELRSAFEAASRRTPPATDLEPVALTG